MYFCEPCNYKTHHSSNFCIHKKSKKHIKNLDNSMSKTIAQSTCKYTWSTCNVDKTIAETFDCKYCQFSTPHKSSFYRHVKSCNASSVQNELKLKLESCEKEKELYKKLEQEKSEFLNNFINNANTIINKTQDNSKIATQAMQTVSMSALKYANEKFNEAPALKAIENFNINDYDIDNLLERKKIVESLMYNIRLKSLDKLLGDHIIKYYKKNKPEEQSIHTTDCSRLNYLVRKVCENINIWEIDKNGINICNLIIKPLIDKCVLVLLEYQKELLEEMSNGNYKNKNNITAIMDILLSIDKGNLVNDINKYIAPYFNLTKK